MSLADDLKPMLTSIRAIPGELGLRPHSVTLVESSWSGAHSGDGTRTDVQTAFLETGQNPKVRWLGDDELAMAGLASGAVDIWPITSDHAAIARLADMRGDDLSDSDARYLLITGPKAPNGARYRIAGITAHMAMHYKLRAIPVEGVSA